MRSQRHTLLDPQHTLPLTLDVDREHSSSAVFLLDVTFEPSPLRISLVVLLASGNSGRNERLTLDTITSHGHRHSDTVRHVLDTSGLLLRLDTVS